MYELTEENIYEEVVDFNLTEKAIDDFYNWYSDEYNYDEYSKDYK